MLSKEICIKCLTQNVFVHSWYGWDDENWDKGFVYCDKVWSNKIEDGPPENCHYLVEQFLHHDATKEEANVE